MYFNVYPTRQTSAFIRYWKVLYSFILAACVAINVQHFILHVYITIFNSSSKVLHTGIEPKPVIIENCTSITQAAIFRSLQNKSEFLTDFLMFLTEHQQQNSILLKKKHKQKWSLDWHKTEQSFKSFAT